ncbi:hypothetical protein ANCCAN_20312 [Ancylostoma caninum]|uniref:Uncharacterized protein n=1 Tax=Ancylostoma caninum TaxID=29170 RepID=A0A368FSQ7_ANCCA|nr:hypothetical protein ANCCAN_20312 [Ancylostoma caninum]
MASISSFAVFFMCFFIGANLSKQALKHGNIEMLSKFQRIFCVCLLLIGIFVPHAIVWISGSLATVAQIHAVFGLIAVGKVTFFRLGLDKRNTWKDAKCASHRIEEIAIVNLSASRSTLVTNIDEGELVHFDSP